MTRPDARISPRWRQALLLFALLASIAASYWVEHAEGDATGTVEAVARGVPAASVEAPSTADEDAPLDLGRLTRRELAENNIDAFRAKSWHVPPPPPPPEPPMEPSAPPLPFQYMGKTEDADGGKTVFYLVHGNEFYAVSPGEEFAGSYRFERVEHTALVIQYLPLSIDQNLPITTGE
ncbi:MAG: hypothetical protein FWD67_10685 [Betaproteobacteria bacterium]|nr:hypothetical protein [Betaproteobacteria bacterium]